MSSGDQLTPCNICGRPGHWEYGCPETHRSCSEEIAKLKEELEAQKKKSFEHYKHADAGWKSYDAERERRIQAEILLNTMPGQYDDKDQVIQDQATEIIKRQTALEAALADKVKLEKQIKARDLVLGKALAYTTLLNQANDNMAKELGVEIELVLGGGGHVTKGTA